MLKHELNAVTNIWARIEELRIRSLDELAPQFRVALEQTIEDCKPHTVIVPGGCIPLDAMVFETIRTNELQKIYFSQKTTRAETADRSWHLYGLAADCISGAYEWFTGAAAKKRWPDKDVRNRIALAWFTKFGEIAKKNGLKWGGDWMRRDMPHVYWGLCRDTPSQISIDARKRGGNEAVWKLVRAA